jgi:hypothetical protein
VSEPIDFASRTGNPPPAEGQEHNEAPRQEREPSNAVYARVGDLVLHSAIDGVRRGVQPEDIIREIRAKHNVHLTVGELRLLLATRRNPDAPNSRKSGMANRTPTPQE